MKRKLPSTSQGDFRNAKRFRLFWLSIISARGASTSSSSEVSPPGPDLLVQSTSPHLRSQMPASEERSVSSTIESSAGSQERFESQVSSIQATPTSTQLSPCSIRNPVISDSQSGVRRNSSPRRFGNARTYRLSWLSTPSAPCTSTFGSSGSSTGSQERVERQISSIQATATSIQLSPCSIRNPVISGTRSGVRNSSAPRFRMRQNPVCTSCNHSQYQNSQRQADRHQDMRMNIDDMSYEELLALGEMIGKVNTGIETSELSNFVKKVICCGEQDNTEQCVICMEQYNDGDEMGLLKCSHDYHFSCISEWMKDQAVCPICRCKAARF